MGGGSVAGRTRDLKTLLCADGSEGDEKVPDETFNAVMTFVAETKRFD